MFLNSFSLGPSVRKDEDPIGFSLIHGDVTLGLDALHPNDKTLWNSKLTEALASYEENERKHLSKQKSGKCVRD